MVTKNTDGVPDRTGDALDRTGGATYMTGCALQRTAGTHASTDGALGRTGGAVQRIGGASCRTGGVLDGVEVVGKGGTGFRQANGNKWAFSDLGLRGISRAKNLHVRCSLH